MMDTAYCAGQLEKLVNFDVGSRGVIERLHDTAQKAGYSLHDTATALLEAVRPGSLVLILTGAQLRPRVDPRIGETDGPLGAVAIGKFVHRGLGGLPVLMVDVPHVDTMNALVREAGYTPVGLAKAREAFPAGYPKVMAVVGDFPVHEANASDAARALVADLDPTAVVAVERVGANASGHYHNTTGRNVDEGRARLHHVVAAARAGGVVTIGIGDGGNEIGMGNVRDSIQEWVPYGKQCRCECQGGVIDATRTDKLLTATVSNWGAYALVACGALLKGSLDLLPSPDLERRLLELSPHAYLIDGMTGFATPTTDGLSLGAQTSIIALLNETVSAFLNQVTARSTR